MLILVHWEGPSQKAAHCAFDTFLEILNNPPHLHGLKLDLMGRDL